MFNQGFQKVAVAVVTLTPEKYYELAREKDPYVGSLSGAVAGAGIGAIKGAKGHKHKSALVGAGIGAISGAASGGLASKALKRYQARRIERLTRELRLRATPARIRSHEEES